MTLALITGATAGIGAEFARQLAARGFDLVLVARDSERLDVCAEGLRADHGISVETIAADLLSVAGLARVEARTAATEQPIDMLLNNAGFGLRGEFDENSADDEQRMLELLVTVPLRLTHAALSQMLPRRSGTIVNIASVAGLAVRGSYGAAKAWMLSFSRWANIHYRGRGVTVTAVAPGFVRTEFHERMRVSTASVPNFMWLRTGPVVRIALRDIERGRAVSIPTIRYKLVAALCRVLPDRVVAAGSLRHASR